MFSAETCASQLRGRNLIRHTDNYESMPRTCNRASITMTTRFRRFDLSIHWFHYLAHKCDGLFEFRPKQQLTAFTGSVGLAKALLQLPSLSLGFLFPGTAFNSLHQVLLWYCMALYIITCTLCRPCTNIWPLTDRHTCYNIVTAQVVVAACYLIQSVENVVNNLACFFLFVFLRRPWSTQYVQNTD